MKAVIALDVWEDWQEAENGTSRWKNTTESLQGADEVRILLGELECATPLRASGAVGNVELLASLLSDKPLNDEILNMPVTYLANKARCRSDLSRRVVLAHTHLIALIQKSNNATWSKPEDQETSDIDKALQTYQPYFTSGGR